MEVFKYIAYIGLLTIVITLLVAVLDTISQTWKLRDNDNEDGDYE